MSDTMRIKPVNGQLVLNPDTYKPLPESGLTVKKTTYWRRRLREGCIEIVQTT